MEARGWKIAGVFLYVTLIILLVAATLLEQVYGTPFVETHIYRSFWFCSLWGTLACVLLRVLRKYRMGMRFSVVWWHGSLLVILGGALLTFLTGEKGYIHLEQGKKTNLFVATSDQVSREMPFHIRLDSFRVAYYPGTEAPMDYLSYVTCWVKGEERKEIISMNHILSVDGYRFYQSSFDTDWSGSWLSVNHDPWGIAVTYAGYVCLLFSAVSLLVSRKETFWNLLHHPVWRKAGLICVLWGISLPVLQAQPVRVLARQDAEKLRTRQVIYQNRVVPFNTLARDFTLKLCGSATYQGLTPEQVVASWLLYPEEWQHEPMFYVKSDNLRRMLKLKSDHVALVDLFDGKSYRLEKVWNEGQRKRQSGLFKGWLEQHQAEKLEKEIRELDEKVGMVLMLRKGTLIQPLPTDGSVEPLSSLRVQAELCYNAIPFSKILFMYNLFLGIAGFFWWLRFYVVAPQVNYKRNWVYGVLKVGLWTSCLVHWGAYLLRWYIGGRIPLGNGPETMLFLAGCLLLGACIWRRRLVLLLPAGLLLSGWVLLVAWLGEKNPQITPLMPVLLSPWLSIHVSLIMISYALFAFICLCSILALVVRKQVVQMERLTLCCRLLLYPAVLLLGVGIFIGAVWANVSWGSYWTWDPKEVWALITFLVYGAAFHWKSFPLFQRPDVFHLYLILAFSTVLMTYFGVNYVLGGMHSYAG